jgi:hypothetical protein
VVAIKVSAGESRNYSHEELNKLSSQIKNQNLYVIVEDFLLDFTHKSKSTHLLSLVTALPEDKIIFIQNSNIFSSEKERIYFLATQDNNLKSLLVMQSINFHVHATRSLQFGFAKAIQLLIRLSTKDKISTMTVDVDPCITTTQYTSVLVDLSPQTTTLPSEWRNLTIGTPEPSNPNTPSFNRHYSGSSGSGSSGTATPPYPPSPTLFYLEDNSLSKRKASDPSNSTTSTANKAPSSTPASQVL